jgi:plasmid stabilization system protein ParE
MHHCFFLYSKTFRSYAADRHNLTRADALIDLIFEGIATLSTHPLIGKLRPELRPDVRSWLVGSHLIFYMI